jgi:hypothetical protein
MAILSLGCVLLADEGAQRDFFQGLVAQICNPVFGRLKQEDQEFKTRLGHIVRKLKKKKLLAFKDSVGPHRVYTGVDSVPNRGSARPGAPAGRIWTFHSIFNFPGTRGWCWGEGTPVSSGTQGPQP